ncbi:MAG: hypothetical protein KF912_06035 [Phycisphaeraceae bacterium]|nr:hypothetical protein [Phycisphaeraceae bacterium]
MRRSIIGIRRRSILGTAALAGVLGLAAVSPGLALAQDAGGVQPFILYEHAPMSAWLVDGKDAGLKQAISMIPARLAELPGEIPDMPPEIEPIVQLALRTLAQPARLAITYNPDNAAGGFFGYGLTLSVQAKDQGHATQLHGILHAALLEKFQEQGMPAPADSMRFKGMQDVQLPFGLISYGPRESKDGWRFELVAGAVDNPDAGFDRLPVPPQGVSPVMRGSLNFAALTPGINMARTLAGRNFPPEGVEVLTGLERAGIIGSEAIAIDFVAGYTATDTTSIVRVKGAGKYASQWHMSKEPVNDKDLAMVPADATMMSIAKGDLSGISALIDNLAQRGVPVNDVLGEFKSRTGVDLRADIIDSIGGTWGAYLSDSTGGGSFGSGVLFASLKDRARVIDAHRRLVAAAGKQLAQQDKGMYIRPTIWTSGEVELMSLRFPGMPVPLEITYAVVGDWFIAGLTPQAVLAASAQALGKSGPGISSNPTFAVAVPKGRNLASVTFVDTPRAAKAGYPFVSMAGSAFANLARSPKGDRDIGLTVPLYADFMKNVKPTTQFSYWDGEDLVTESHADRSMLVNVAGAMGSGGAFWPLLIAIPAIAEGAERGRFGMGPWDHDFVSHARRTALALIVSPEMILDPVRRRASIAAIGLVWKLD